MNQRELATEWASTLLLAVNLLASYFLAAGLFLPVAVLGVAMFAVMAALLAQSWSNITIAILTIGIALVVLSSPIAAWDARSIWFFHAKRIFLHGDLYVVLDNYFPLSHNDYPNLVPALAATLAHAVGHWNEVFPRLAIVVAYVPALALLRLCLPSLGAFFALVTLLFVIGRDYVLNGYMDFLIAVYMASFLLLALRTAVHWEEAGTERWTRLVRQFGGLAKVDRVGFYAANFSIISAVA